MIFFDLDGTLIDSNGVWLQVDEEFLSKRGLVSTPEYIQMVSHSRGHHGGVAGQGL